MSKAFQCDNCLECFVGDAHKVLPNGDEVCSDCFRTIKALSTINPVAGIKLRSDKPGTGNLQNILYILVGIANK